MNAALKKSNDLGGEHRHELPSEIAPRTDRPTDRTRAETKALFLRRADELRKEADELENEARGLRIDADDLVRRVTQQDAPQQASGPAKIDDWSRVDRATAMHQFMRNFPKGKRVKIADVVAALTQGGCDVAGKFRPDQKDYHKEAERNLFITASRNHDIYEYDKKTREIWRI